MGIPLEGVEHHIPAIMNAAWMVRHYARGAELRDSSPLRQMRSQAIQHLGLVVREAFNQCDDFEPLLTAIIDALSKHPPAF